MVSARDESSDMLPRHPYGRTAYLSTRSATVLLHLRSEAAIAMSVATHDPSAIILCSGNCNQFRCLRSPTLAINPKYKVTLKRGEAVGLIKTQL